MFQRFRRQQAHGMSASASVPAAASKSVSASASVLTLLSGQNMKYYIWNGILFSIVTSLYKPYAQKFLYRLNGNDFDISLFNALPGLVILFTMLPGLLLINRGGTASKKKTIAISFLFSRVFILTLVLVPFMPKQLQPMAFVGLTSIMSFPDSVSTTALQSYTGDLFLNGQSAIAIADRNKYSAFVNFIILILLGVLMRKYGNSNQKTIGIYQLLFVAAFVISIPEILAFWRLRTLEIKPHAEEGEVAGLGRLSTSQILKEVRSNRKFVLFMGCSMMFHFAWQMGWPLFSIYQINVLGADELWLTVLGVTSGISMFMSYNFWKNLILCRGNRTTIAFATLGMAVTPILFVLSPNLYALTAAGLVTGFFTAGTTTVIVSSLLEVAGDRNRDLYFGIHATLTSLTLFLSPFFGNYILAHSSIYVALIVTSVLRVIGSGAFFLRRRV